MRRTVDARGLPCPHPVLLTMKAIGTADLVTTIVDNKAAVENVTRLASSKGCSVEVLEQEDGTYINIERVGAAAEEETVPANVDVASEEATAGPLVLFAPSDAFGRGPAELGEKLMGAFFHALLEVEPKPSTAIFMNSGVKLVVQGSSTVDDIRMLAERGVEVLACGACLNYFELSDELAVGRVSNMYDIAGALLGAGKIVEL